MSYSDWKTTKLFNLINTISETYKFSENQKVVLINTSDILEGKVLNHNKVLPVNVAGQFKKTFKKNDILYSEIRPANKRYAYIDFESKNYVASTKLMVLRIKNNEIDTKFLYQFLKSEDTLRTLQAVAESRSGTFPQITFTELSNLEINLPTIKEQETIANILSSLDDKIELNNKINKNLEELAQTLYKRWFVDFEFPNEDGEPYKSSGGEMVDSELGMIPKGWEAKTIDEITAFNKRGLAPKYGETKNGTPVINQRCIRNHTIIEEAVQYHDNTIKKAPNNLYHQPWDVLINSMGVGTLGRVSISSISEFKLVHSCITILRANNRVILEPIFSYMMLGFESAFIEMGEGSTGQTSLNNKLLGKLEVVVPPMNLQQTIVSFFKDTQEKIDNNYSQNKRLVSIRDELLPKLMSGEIEVPIEE